MGDLFSKLKFKELVLIELISIIIAIIIYKLFQVKIPDVRIIIIDVIIYVIPSIWIINRLSKYGSSVRELFKPIKFDKSIIINMIMVLMLFLNICLIVIIPIAFYDNIDARNYWAEDFTLVKVISSVIMAPIAEELFFRGYVLNKLAVKGSIKKAIIVSSIIFGLVHLFGGIHAAIGGFCFAIMYVKYKNLFIPIILHICYNGFLYLYRFFSYKNILKIDGEVFPWLLVIIIALLITSILWFIRFIKNNSNIFIKN